LVGGDFDDAVRGPSGWTLIVGDVAGRGAEAAALTAQARHTLRAVARLDADPVAPLRHLNEELCAVERYALCTAALVLVSEPTAPDVRVTVVCAGHPPPLVVRGY